MISAAFINGYAAGDGFKNVKMISKTKTPDELFIRRSY
jgi:hypothetical protein